MKMSNLKEWKEVARWIKFEETVESEGNRWSKPHVSTPSLAGWMQLRKFFRSGLILLDVEARDMGKICDIVAAALASTSEGTCITARMQLENCFLSTFIPTKYQCTNMCSLPTALYTVFHPFVGDFLCVYFWDLLHIPAGRPSYLLPKQVFGSSRYS